VGSIPANPDAQNVPSFRRWRFEMKLIPFNAAAAAAAAADAAANAAEAANASAAAIIFLQFLLYISCRNCSLFLAGRT
jgi:hypothetical protein